MRTEVLVKEEQRRAELAEQNRIRMSEFPNQGRLHHEPDPDYDWKIRTLLGAGFTDDQADAILEVINGRK